MSANGTPTSERFCDLCADLISIWPTSPEPHYATFTDLEASAATGCALCRLFHYALSQERLSDDGFDAVETIKNPHVRYRTRHLLTLHRQLDERYGNRAKFQCYAAQNGKTSSSSLCLKFQRVDEVDGTNLLQTSLPILSTIGRDSEVESATRLPEQAVSADFAVCSKWLKDCIGHTLPAGSRPAHFACPLYREEKMPTRVLHLTSSKQDGKEHIHLIESSGIVGKYVTLSWCWGEAGSFKTTTQNLEQHLQGIACDNLPQTFKDAITMTRSLGFDYLWIDALCIVQDDARDWQRECSLMASVYERSAVTIAAAAARNQHTGFLHFHQPHPPPDCVLPRRKVGLLKLTGPYCVTIPDVLNIRGKEAERLPTSNLLTRGWCLQERLLSPHVLYFGDSEIWYDCSKGRFRERYPGTCNEHATLSAGSDAPNQHGLSSNGAFASHPNDPLELWLLIVAEYTICNVSYPGDLLPALSGLARTLQNRYEHSERPLGQYAAGVWMHERVVHRCLLWSAGSAGFRMQLPCTEGILPNLMVMGSL